MKIRTIQLALILAGLAAGFPFQASAQASPSSPMGQGGNSQDMAPGGPGDAGEGEHHHRPPLEAIAACQGKTGGARCSFVGRQNETLNGTCFAPNSGGLGQAAAKPSIGKATMPNASAQMSPPLACRPDRLGQDSRAPGG